MAKAATRYSRIRRTGWWSRLFVLVAAFAFGLQSFIIQTHFHGPATWPDRGVGPSLSNPAPHGPFPADSNPLDCPFCQAIAHTGAFFAPGTPFLIAPVGWAFHVIITAASAAIAVSPTISWHSRAPPQV
jgi:hypothetical protein